MKIITTLISLLLLAMPGVSRAQDEEMESELNKEGKIKYVLILPEEKAPEIVKPTEQNPFSGTTDASDKEQASGEETKVAELLRALPVVGRSSRSADNGWVMLGDIILRKGGPVPPVLANQNVSLVVQDITPEAIVLTFVEKKPTGLTPRTLTIPTDLSPRVTQRLAGQSNKAGAPPQMGISGASSRLLAGEKKRVLRAEPVGDEPPAAAPAPAARTEDTANSLLNMFFGNQVKEPAKPEPPKEEAK